ncbi:unnamed protein product [Adineta steineri]|uniref:NHL repeat containing protein-like protein n=1 Tax=Adineta steineri TaxID=433720 RepID=A0A819WII5_9BILA|nr:unnamed protein product [Adineta steineri]CAF4123181.1 unnamed protein product [Adineta steineri]
MPDSSAILNNNNSTMMMTERTPTSIRSTAAPGTVTEQPNRLSRWWMRHHVHIGLASMGGSAILICIIAVILLPIVFKNPSKDDPCMDEKNPLIKPPEWNSKPPSTFDPLCAANATWTSEGITVAGSSNSTDPLSKANLNSPNDILVDFDSNLLIADSGNNRIACWPATATVGYIVSGTGSVGSWANLYKHPAAIVVLNDQMYVSDLGNYRVVEVPLSTEESAPDGITVVGHYGAGSAPNQINSVHYMSIDNVHQLLYLSDNKNNRILQLNLTNYILSLIAGTGQANSNNISLDHPLGITIDEMHGLIYVADSHNHRVQKFNFQSTVGITVAGGIGSGQNLSQLNLPSGVAIDPFGNVYVADTGNNRIVQWLVGSQQGRIIAGTGTAGASNKELNSPVQLKFDSHHNLYVVDKNNNRIQRFNLLYNGC